MPRSKFVDALKSLVLALVCSCIVAMAAGQSPAPASGGKNSASSAAAQGGNPFKIDSPSTALDPDVLGKFSRRATVDAVTTMTLAEDGERFVTAHEQANLLLIWDVRTAKVVKAVHSTAPRFVLWRGNRIFVANFGKGTISVHDATKNFEMVSQVLVGERDVCYLSAPQGKFFQGKILATCICAVGRTDPSRYRVLLVDVNKDQHSIVRSEIHMSVANVDYTGRYFFVQGSTGTPYLGVGPVYDFEGLVKNAPAPRDPQQQTSEMMPQANLKVLSNGQSFNAALLHQVADGPYWFGGKLVFNGLPPKAEAAKRGLMVIPDSKQNTFYVLNSGNIECYGLDAAMSLIGQKPVSYPPPAEMPRLGADHHLLPGDYPRGPYYQHFAVTLDSFVFFYILDGEREQIFHCRIDAFQPQPARN